MLGPNRPVTWKTSPIWFEAHVHQSISRHIPTAHHQISKRGKIFEDDRKIKIHIITKKQTLSLCCQTKRFKRFVYLFAECHPSRIGLVAICGFRFVCHLGCSPQLKPKQGSKETGLMVASRGALTDSQTQSQTNLSHDLVYIPVTLLVWVVCLFITDDDDDDATKFDLIVFEEIAFTL